MRFLRTIKPYWKRILVLLLLGIAAEGVQLASPMLQKILIDDVLTPGSGSSFWSLPRIMTVFVAFYLISTLLSFLVSRFNSVLGAKITLDLRAKMFKHIQSLSQRFFDENKAGTISSRISSSASGVNTIINIWISFITNSFSIATSLIILFTLSPKLSAYALIVLPIYYLFFINFQIRIKRNWRALHTLRDKISGNLVEKLAAMKVLRVFSMLDREHKTYQDQIGEEANLNVKPSFSTIIWAHLRTPSSS